MNGEVLSIDNLSEEIKKTNKELQELKKGLDNLSVVEKNNKIEYYNNIISSYFEKLEDLQTETGINKIELSKLRLQTYLLKIMYNNIQNEIKGETLSEMNRLENSVNNNINNDKNIGNQSKGNNFRHTLKRAGLIGGSAVLLDKIFGRIKYIDNIPGYKDMTRKQKRKARRKWKKENNLSFWEKPLGKFLKWTGTGFGLISGINALKNYINGKNNVGGNQENPNNSDLSSSGSNGVSENLDNNGHENVFQRWRKAKEIPNNKETRMKWLFPDGTPKSPEEMKEYLTTIEVPTYTIEGKVVTKKLNVHKKLSNEISEIFHEMCNNKFPINSAGCYNWRYVVGSSTKKRSQHSYGSAVDINPSVNGGGNYGHDNPNSPYFITDKIVKIWEKRGFNRGGRWRKRDPMHFSFVNG